MNEERVPSVDLNHKELFDLLKHVEKGAKSKKDIWDIMAAATPLISGLLVSSIGLYFAYTNNEAQLKLQETQTIERFFPHLSGNEQEKKAAILAISSLTNTETAAKYAELFPSEGTASALKTIADSSSVKDHDKAVANKALVSTFHKMADGYQATQNTTQAAQAYKQSLDAQEKLVGCDSPELVDNLNQLVEAYKSNHQYALAEATTKRILKIQKNSAGSRSPQFIESLNKLAAIFKLEGKSDAADHVTDYANLLSEQKASDQAQASASNVSTAQEISTLHTDTAQSKTATTPPSDSSAQTKDTTISQDISETNTNVANSKSQSEPSAANPKSANTTSNVNM